jgi:hypothetical protein
LKLVEKRPFEECFGGAYYLFLRGMRMGKQNGIYFCSGLELTKRSFSAEEGE